MEKFMTTERVAELLSISTWTVYDLIRNGKIAAIKVGRDWRISETSLNSFINVQTYTPPKTVISRQVINKKSSQKSNQKLRMEDVWPKKQEVAL